MTIRQNGKALTRTATLKSSMLQLPCCIEKRELVGKQYMNMNLQERSIDNNARFLCLSFCWDSVVRLSPKQKGVLIPRSPLTVQLSFSFNSYLYEPAYRAGGQTSGDLDLDLDGFAAHPSYAQRRMSSMPPRILAYITAHRWLWPPLLLAGAVLSSILHNVFSGIFKIDEPVFFL